MIDCTKTKTLITSISDSGYCCTSVPASLLELTAFSTLSLLFLWLQRLFIEEMYPMKNLLSLIVIFLAGLKLFVFLHRLCGRMDPVVRPSQLLSHIKCSLGLKKKIAN